jgi:glycosyltransferase involved in cell wall biosynthesis
MGGGLTILFTNIWLEHYAGSEVVVRDLALGSLRRGHRPIVYTPAIGPFAHELTARGVAVVDDLRKVAEAPDVIHAHHVVPCAEAVMRFPEAPAINVCHAFEYWGEAPAHFPQIGVYVAVDDACRDRLVHTQGIDSARVVVLPNAVDLSRVPARPRPLPDRPRRAAAFGKAVGVAQARAACEALSIEFAALGPPAGHEVSDPERHLVEFDLVFASARAALEALCCGCAVIACDARGIAGLVTSENFAALRAKNFGLRSLTTPISVQGLVDEVRRYDRDDARLVCERARREADLERLLDAFEGLYDKVISAARASPVTRQAHEAAVARFLRDYLPRRPHDPRWPWLADRQALTGRVAQLERELGDSAHRLEQSRVEAAEARAALQAARQTVAAIKRSRLLRLGRWLRRIGRRPLPY